MEILVDMLIVFGFLASSLLFLCAFYLVSLLLYARKLEKELPIGKWLTLRELALEGYSEYCCKEILPAFYKNGMLEVELEEKVMKEVSQEGSKEEWEEIQRRVRELGFHQVTIELYNFRFVPRGGRHYSSRRAAALALRPVGV